MTIHRKLAFAVALTSAATIGAFTAAPAQCEEWQSSQVLGVPPAAPTCSSSMTWPVFKKYSRVKNFEIVGHAYLRGPWINPAFGHVGMAMNTMRVCDSRSLIWPATTQSCSAC